jgi:hypothetical protein
VALAEDEISYCGSVEDVGPSTSWGDIGPPHTHTDVTCLSSSWTSWGDALNPSTSAPGLFTSWGGY